MSAEDVKAELTVDWLAKAQEDLAAAERTALPPPLPNVVAFHSQQAVEKALKGFLTWNDRSFPKTHDLLTLVSVAEQCDPSLGHLQDAARLLNPHAISPRYPGPLAHLTPDEAMAALTAARAAVPFICDRLPVQARPDS